MPVTIPANRAGPTGTKTLAENYRRHLQRPLNALITDVRKGIIDEDVFGLRVTADTLAKDDLPPVMRLDRSERQQDLFRQWLDRRLQEGVLEQIQRDDNPYIRSAYVRGVRDGTRMVRAAGGEAPKIDAVFDLPIHQRTVKRQFERNYADLEDITKATSKQVASELAEGLAKGENPRKVAKRITDRIDKVGKTRAETLARTRIVDAHSEATINRYENLGVDAVQHSEWRTARDDRVCPICERLDERELTLDEAREGTFDITEDDLGEDESTGLAGTYQLRPPAHPRCRCVLLPVIT